ncbi:DNA repair protein RAD50 isoform X3 [Folsomia candida]|uniref:DNA repair protein RAD50 isoform X3 n=1 Tax=Folsomia candida TaxID=158441 RepID=UPI000B9024B0|nr:DNA repair protein RAD50 isoform X3 [Folsomia candida]
MAVVFRSLKFYGLRSFNKSENESWFHEIKFHPNLTIIKGRNGSGKTTLIECLVFGLTGKLSSSPEGLASFINGADTGLVAEIIITLTKGEDLNEIAWLIERPKKKLTATCNITCNGVPIHGGTLSCEDAEKEIKQITNLPSGAIEKLLLVPQEDAFWPFGTATNLKQELKTQTPLLKPALEKSTFVTQVKNKNRAARDEQRRLSTVISALEEESKDLEIKLKKYKEVNELEVKFQHAEDIVKALKISVDEISNVNQESLDDDMRRLANEILESNNESSKETKLKQNLEKELQEITAKYYDVNTRATVKQEEADTAKLKFERLSQSFENLSQDTPNFLETDVPLYIDQLEEKQKQLEDEYQKFLNSRTENERRKARIETVLLENEKNTARENANLAKLKDNLALCTIQDGKLSLLDNKMPEFMERVEIHKREIKKKHLRNESLWHVMRANCLLFWML